ncbi:MAG: peptidoglycan-associated lipoprotein Pal [Desulfuromonadales bacterium]|nr:peptidoglycan-associated lipoprotein Pal [Desulfuromonadales bacterium]
MTDRFLVGIWPVNALIKRSSSVILVGVFLCIPQQLFPRRHRAMPVNSKHPEEASMIPRFLFLTSVLFILILPAGCAKKSVPDNAVAVAEPVEVNEPNKVDPVPPPVVVEEKASLEDAGLFTLDRSDLKTIYFAYDSYELSSGAIESIEENAELLKSDPTYFLRLEGHCDDRGSDEYNLSLGEKRAMSVMNYLASLGIDKSRLTIVSYGEEMPVANGRDEASWAKNRRVEFN